VSDPKALVRAWHESKDAAANDARALWHESPDNLREISTGRHVVCNMPPEFRHDFYTDHALVGFGACFHRDAPERAFKNWPIWPGGDIDFFHRTCDIVFTALTPRVLVDVPKTNLWWAEDESRMWRQPAHIEERTRMLELVKKVRDA
jgi:hypothetical protein